MGVRGLALLAIVSTAFAADPLYELVGQFSPPSQASVSLFGVAGPFTTSTLSDEDGKFTFKKIQAGAYTISVFLPAMGEARQTIEVGPSKADSRQRVSLALHFKESDFVGAAALRRHTVPAKQLAIADKAIREYEEAQKALARHDSETAVKRLEHAVEMSPQFGTAWNTLGTIAYQTQEYARAEECFRTALEQEPGLFEPLVNLGGVLINLHKLDEAWDYNVHAVLMRPKDALAQAQLGMTYFELGKADLAEKHLQEARNLDPAHFSHPQLFLAEIHFRRGDKHQAAADLEDFLQHHPDWPQAAKMRATIAEWRQ